MSISCVRRLRQFFSWLCVALLAGAMGVSQAAGQPAERREGDDSPPARESERQPNPRDTLRHHIVPMPGAFGPQAFAPRGSQGADSADQQMRMLERILEMPLLKRHIELIEENVKLKAQLEIQERTMHMQRQLEGQGGRERPGIEGHVGVGQMLEMRERAEREHAAARERAEKAEREHAEQRERMQHHQRLNAENEMLRHRVRELEAKLHELQTDLRAKMGGDRQDARHEEAERGEARHAEARRDDGRRGDEARRHERHREEARDDDKDEDEADDDEDEDDDDDDEDKDEDEDEDDDDRD